MNIDINSAWTELKRRVAECTKCGLCRSRKTTVFGEGPETKCRCMIIGEAPGEEEDKEGQPFVGPAGQLLTSILEKGGHIDRSSVYITNTVKCRPPKNRNPYIEEKQECRNYLEAQLLLLQPDIVVTMGNVPTQWLLNVSDGITRLRGQWITWRGIKLFPMYHPSYLLRQTGSAEVKAKQETWDDVRQLKAELDRLEQKQGGQ